MTEVSRASIHHHTLALFLRTDLHRLEAALDERGWTTDAGRRLTDHLRFAAQVEATILEGRDPRDPTLRAALDRISPDRMEAALAALEQQTQGLLERIAALTEGELYAPVVESFERGLTVLGHLYDYCRASAMLVEWARGYEEKVPDQGTLADLTGTDPLVF